MPGDYKLFNAPPLIGTSERARPVLGAQLALPGTTPFHYVREVEDSRPSLELVSLGPYYEENHDSMQLAISQLTDLDLSIVQLPVQALYLLANGGYRPQGGYTKRSTIPRGDTPLGLCYECNGPHLVRDCPAKKERNMAANASGCQAWPRVLGYCGGCGNGHLAKYCPSNPAETKTLFGYVEVIPLPSTSETESDRIPLRLISRTQANSAQMLLLLTPIEEISSQPGNPQDQSKPNRRKHRRSKDKIKIKNEKKESSSGS